MSEQNEWTDDQLKRIQKWLHDKWSDVKLCPKCNQQLVTLGRSPAHLIVGPPQGEVRLGESYPCFALTCTNCAYLQLVSAPLTDIDFATPDVPPPAPAK